MRWPGSRQTPTVDDNRVAASLSHLQRQEHRARGFSFLPKQPVRSILTGRHGSRLRGRGLNFEELRHYLPGDDIRTMDWKVTNRTGKPHVRVYTEERERQVHLVVDQRISMFFGSQRAMKSVVAAEIAALIAWRVLATGDRLGALIFDDQKSYGIPARRSRENVTAILSRLAQSNAALAAGTHSNPQRLNEVLEDLGRVLSHDALIIYVGDGLGWSAQSDELVKRLTAHNDLIVVNISDPAEARLPHVPELVVSDGAQQISVRRESGKLEQKFEESFESQRVQMRRSLKRFALPMIEIDTIVDPLEQLMRSLGAVR